MIVSISQPTSIYFLQSKVDCLQGIRLKPISEAFCTTPKPFMVVASVACPVSATVATLYFAVYGYVVAFYCVIHGTLSSLGNNSHFVTCLLIALLYCLADVVIVANHATMSSVYFKILLISSQGCDVPSIHCPHKIGRAINVPLPHL